MPHGKTEELIMFSRSLRYYPKKDRPTRERDRTLRGKQRIRARKEAQRAGSSADAD
jgi:hypothetical protein